MFSKNSTIPQRLFKHPIPQNIWFAARARIAPRGVYLFTRQVQGASSPALRFTFSKQIAMASQKNTGKAKIVVDKNDQLIVINAPEGWTTDSDRLKNSSWSNVLGSWMKEEFGLNNIRVVMASTKESKLSLVVIQCGKQILYWDEAFNFVHEIIEPKDLPGIAKAMEMKKKVEVKQVYGI